MHNDAGETYYCDRRRKTTFDTIIVMNSAAEGCQNQGRGWLKYKIKTKKKNPKLFIALSLLPSLSQATIQDTALTGTVGQAKCSRTGGILAVIGFGE